MTKKFNHGLTNYIKLGIKPITHHTSEELKKYISKKKGKKKVKKPTKLYSNKFLVKKIDEEIKKNEVQDNFLQKALMGVAGHKLNISMDDDEEKEANKEKEIDEKTRKLVNNEESQDKKDEISSEQKDLELKEKKILEKKQEEKDIELLKQYIGIYKGKYAIGKHEIEQLPNLFSNNSDASKKNKFGNCSLS